MSTVLTAVVVLTVAVNTAIAVADFAGARFVLANAAAAGVPSSWLLALGALKAAGAAGLVIGLLGFRPVGIAAATGLVLYYIGAVLTLLRARLFGGVVYPGVFLVLAGASLGTVLVG
ncbi:DoxX family protein [Streptomyces sp. NPDC006798]|uniref:DoxX family protein n=1 Tax=Streptomyces sp. NPDC006798 TaxID=3155462 RepID=UPI00340E0FAF